MRSLFIAGILLIGVAYCKAQGLVAVNNNGYLISFQSAWYPSAPQPIPAYSTTPGQVYRVAILYGPQNLTFEGAFAPYSQGALQAGASVPYLAIPQIGTNANQVGRLSFGNVVEIPGSLAGSTVSLLMVGWLDTGDLSSWNDFLSKGGLYGTSGEVELVLGGGDYPNMNFFGDGNLLPKQSDGFTVRVVPEPSSMAFASMATAALVLLRRRLLK